MTGFAKVYVDIALRFQMFFGLDSYTLFNEFYLDNRHQIHEEVLNERRSSRYAFPILSREFVDQTLFLISDRFFLPPQFPVKSGFQSSILHLQPLRLKSSPDKVAQTVVKTFKISYIYAMREGKIIQCTIEDISVHIEQTCVIKMYALIVRSGS